MERHWQPNTRKHCRRTMSFTLAFGFLSFYMKDFHNGHIFGILISCKLMIQEQSSLDPGNTESSVTQTLNVGSTMGCGSGLHMKRSVFCLRQD